jgi:hypothetical protein
MPAEVRRSLTSVLSMDVPVYPAGLVPDVPVLSESSSLIASLSSGSSTLTACLLVTDERKPRWIRRSWRALQKESVG